MEKQLKLLRQIKDQLLREHDKMRGDHDYSAYFFETGDTTKSIKYREKIKDIEDATKHIECAARCLEAHSRQ